MGCRKIIYILISYVIFVEAAMAYDTVVDQSQSGEMNVEVSMKNVEIIAVLGGKEQYTDYDYNYDYTEMTIKPPNKTSTASPHNSTSNSTVNLETTTAKVVEITPKEPPSFTQETNASESSTPSSESTAAEATTGKLPSQASSSPPAAVDNPESCRKGFHRNKKGECELKIKPSSTNALLKLAELSQKLKLRRANN